MHKRQKPRIAITLGDPAGIGCEIAVRCLQDSSIYQHCNPILFGSPEVVERDVARFAIGAEVESIELTDLDDCDEASPGSLRVVATSGRESLIPYGEVRAEGGKAAVAAVETSVSAAMAGYVQGICTAPLNKESMRLAGYSYDGHTEMLAEFSGSGPVSMLLLGEKLRVAHLTTHTSIRKVPALVTEDRIVSVACIADAAMRRLGFGSPRLALAGLNPHAGENGLFGDEEKTLMGPALDRLRDQGIHVAGPVSADAVFIDAMAGKHDLVIVAYHDQGHIPVKLIEREKAVNVTGGLPIVRTSVDHGTAFDIAGKGIASATNMAAALLMAARMSDPRLTYRQEKRQ
jgi:4-hydroxythreonine-4-phosphate dehydrogenase